MYKATVEDHLRKKRHTVIAWRETQAWFIYNISTRPHVAQNSSRVFSTGFVRGLRHVDCSIGDKMWPLNTIQQNSMKRILNSNAVGKVKTKHAQINVDSQKVHFTPKTLYILLQIIYTHNLYRVA